MDIQGRVGVAVDQHPQQVLGPQGRLKDEDRTGHAAGDLGYAGEDVAREGLTARAAHQQSHGGPGPLSHRAAMMGANPKGPPMIDTTGSAPDLLAQAFDAVTAAASSQTGAAS